MENKKNQEIIEEYMRHEKELGADFDYEPCDLDEALAESQVHTVWGSNTFQVKYGMKWYTPQPYIDAARELMGDIDVDPATEVRVQKRIQAKTFYIDDPKSNGLIHNWYGRVWLNPPYDNELTPAFINKAIDEYLSGNLTEGIIMTHTSETCEEHFIRLLSAASACCFIRGHVKWWKGHWPEEIKMGMLGLPWRTDIYSVHSNGFFYLGNNSDKFKTIFSRFGVCYGK